MKAIILSAGQGKRLRPLTEKKPKCLLPVRGDKTVLELQLEALATCGIEEAVVFVGFGAEEVEDFLVRRTPEGIEVRTIFNPLYEITDNLVTVWLAQQEMDEEFIILNGDTLFEPAVLERLLTAPHAPLTLAVNEKDGYDDDDMKVIRDGGTRLRAVGKQLDPDTVDCESIGLMVFRGEGPDAFRRVIQSAIRQPDALKRWYLSIVNEMAQGTRVETAAITGLWWGELDCPEDLAEVRAALEQRERKREARAFRAQFARA